MTSDTRTPARKSLQRRIAWFGADRLWVGGSGLLLGVVGVTMFRGFGFFYAMPIIVPCVLWALLVWVGREMYKADPYMIEVLYRHFQYRRWYAPKSDLGVDHPQIHDYR